MVGLSIKARNSGSRERRTAPFGGGGFLGVTFRGANHHAEKGIGFASESDPLSVTAGMKGWLA